MLKAATEFEVEVKSKAHSNIVTGNFLELDIKKPFLDLLITSPPYVTSYEYADLHQLSSLWLDITDDYRTLRQGSIGSIYHSPLSQSEIYTKLNNVGSSIYIEIAKTKQ